MNTKPLPDTVLELKDFPASCTGAPCPVLLAEEGSLWIAYYLEESATAWDGNSVQVVSSASTEAACGLVEFTQPIAHKFGGPNDEAFEGHPLASRGLEPYAGFEVSASSWIAELERMNSVHPMHDPRHYAKFRHFILAFHDNVFECVATGYRASTHAGSVREVLLRQQHEA